MYCHIRANPLKGKIMKNTTVNSEFPLSFSSRESLLSANSELIEQLQGRLKVKRFRPQEGDSLKLAYIRAYIQALQLQNTILKDIELGEVEERLKALEEKTSEVISKSSAQCY
jgi:hypothetical protein